MKSRSSPSMSPSILIFLPIFISCIESFSSLVTQETRTRNNNILRISLVDRDSPLSPIYDPNSTTYDRSRGLIHHSMARLLHLQSSINSPKYLVLAPLTWDTVDYIVKLFVGTPPSEVTAILDTGAQVTWIQCLPCKKCFQQTKPIFDPSKSSTYNNVPCGSPSCKKLYQSNCNGGLCQYRATYSDGAYSEGSFATETFTFDTADRRNISLIDVAFGCSHNYGGLFKGNLAGMLSMGQGPLSLINQVNQRRFSYCLAPRGGTYPSHLQFGVTPSLEGNTTPMFEVIGSEYLYYLFLEDISFGSEALHIPIEAFRPSNTQGLVIDTGTSIDILDSSGFDLIVQAIQKVMKLKEIPDPRQELELCYDGTLNDLIGFPSLTYHFMGGAKLVLGPHSLFKEIANRIVCLAMLRNHGGISIIGSLSQQNYIIGYDLVEKLISFGPSDCRYF